MQQAAFETTHENERPGKHLRMRGISKRFGSTLANDNIDLDIHAGEVLSLLGENGAGKTTLMSILYGLCQADSGTVSIDGQPVDIQSPRQAIEEGIGMVHQHLMLVPSLTVAENIMLGLPSPYGLLNVERSIKRIKEVSAAVGLDVNPKTPVWQLSIGEQQRVEIVKALYRGAELLILDEPTAVLTPQEATELIGMLRRLAESGTAVIFITHKLREALSVSDRIMVLRSGKVAYCGSPGGMTPKELGRIMVGRDLKPAERVVTATGDPAIEIEDVWALDDGGLPALKGLSLEIKRGEIVGLAGVSGNGQLELAQAVAGLRHVTEGTIRILGKLSTNLPRHRVIESGFGYIPEDRMAVGIVRSFSVSENLMLMDLGRPPYVKNGIIQRRAVKQHVKGLIHDYGIKTPSEDLDARNLSGGHIQRLIVARELSRQPRALVACYPTRGLDIGASEYVSEKLLEMKSAGTGILLISEDLDQILSLSDRIAVIYEGKIVRVARTETFDAGTLGLLMAGGGTDED